MKKGIMIHYFPEHCELARFNDITYEDYKKTVKETNQDFTHIFVPTFSREGVEVLSMPEVEPDKKVL